MRADEVRIFIWREVVANAEKAMMRRGEIAVKAQLTVQKSLLKTGFIYGIIIWNVRADGEKRSALGYEAGYDGSRCGTYKKR